MSDDTDKPQVDTEVDSDEESESDDEQQEEQLQQQEDVSEPVTADQNKQDEQEAEPKLEQKNKQGEKLEEEKKSEPMKEGKTNNKDESGDKQQEKNPEQSKSDQDKPQISEDKSKTNVPNAKNAAPTGKNTTVTQVAKLKKENAEQADRLKLEENARQELEEMILRLEKQVKAETAGRKKMEELLKKAVESESNLKQRMDEELSSTQHSLKQVEFEREQVEKDKEVVNQMRDKFDTQIADAHSEVQKAQEALQTAEDRIRATEQIERVKLQTEYQQRMQYLMQEIERLRGELVVRTELMNSELSRWRQQAELTALAVVDAKNEVMERKRELDGTKEKMDRLVEKLYIGRERGLELQGSLAYAQLHHGAEQQIKKKLLALQAPGYGQMEMGVGGSQFSTMPGMTPMMQQQLQDVGNKVGRKASAQKLAPLQMDYGFGGGEQSAFIEDVSQGYADVAPRYMQRTMQALKKGQEGSNDRRQKPKKKGGQDRFGEMQTQAASVSYMSKW